MSDGANKKTQEKEEWVDCPGGVKGFEGLMGLMTLLLEEPKITYDTGDWAKESFGKTK